MVDKFGFANSEGNLMKKKIEDIVAAYNSEIRGSTNYYCICQQRGIRAQIWIHYGTVCTIPLQEKPNNCNQRSLTNIRLEMTLLFHIRIKWITVQKFYNEGFKRKPPMYYTEVNGQYPYIIAIPQPTLTERLDARTCELCGKVGPVVNASCQKAKSS